MKMNKEKIKEKVEKKYYLKRKKNKQTKTNERN